jgi:prephenate dehydrogenase
MVIIATPVKDIIKLLKRLKPFLSKQCLVTDTGSTKTDIIKEAWHVFSDEYDFIGGHPMAGLEKGGIEYAYPDLFEGKPYLIVPKSGNSSTAGLKMSSLVNRIGAIEIKMDATEHDRVVALVSHLPQLIAVLMTNMLGSAVQENDKEQYFRIGGNVFNEMTRVASSPFAIWKDIYQTNRTWTVASIEALEDLLEKAKEKITKNPVELEEDFNRAKYLKEKML